MNSMQIVDVKENSAIEFDKLYQLKAVDFFLTTLIKERDLKLFESMLRNKHYNASCSILINTEQSIIKVTTKIAGLINDKVITSKGSAIPKYCILDVRYE